MTSASLLRLIRSGQPSLRAVGRLLALLDARDVFFFAGLVIAGAGGWRLSPAWTLVAIGALLAAVGLFMRGPRAGGT